MDHVLKTSKTLIYHIKTQLGNMLYLLRHIKSDWKAYAVKHCIVTSKILAVFSVEKTGHYTPSGKLKYLGHLPTK